ncbi:hypothetical protein [Desertivibrio insolitus]|uniref:hypothetical protein n=1 Tax=Herbiconiux sp. SYSU D00978 TaxID=2812562 RepID=UPI001A9604BE|nr:hypothetical protein [Herbiconiux sp. SYSU D00978]
MEELFKHRIVLTRDLPTAGERSVLHRAVLRGHYVRIAPGASVPAEDWRNLSSEARHRLTACALQLLHPTTVFCSVTAALLWQRPLLGAAPERAHALASGARNSGSSASFRRHERIGDVAVRDLEGVRVTSLEGRSSTSRNKRIAMSRSR